MTLLSSMTRTSLTFKIFFIALLVLVLLIPMNMIENIISERSHLYRQANTDISSVWGEGHTVAGPVLTLPRSYSAKTSAGWTQSLHYKQLPPETLNVSAAFDTQLRYRGIYKVPVYLATISIKGHFVLPDKLNPGLVDHALIQIPFARIKSLKKTPVLLWNGSPLALVAVADDANKEAVVFQAALPKNSPLEADFEILYEAAGSSEFNLFSWAKNTKLTIDSDWGSPSFQGQFFPTTHQIRDDGFNATWNINMLFVNSGRSTLELISNEWFANYDKFGVKFILPADTYQLVTRSTKYAVLFISLTFMIYFLVEILGGNNLHAIQYLFIGLANCIFYLLLLSLSEHINFNIAYFLSAGSSTLLISLYSKSVLQNTAKALLVFFVLAVLYVYLFITLQSEGFALLTGSLGLFVIMAILMYVTRNTNWRALSLPDQ